jgi:hypothetical protein
VNSALTLASFLTHRSFDPLSLVNTYGAFGTVGKERPEVIIKGTYNETIGPKVRLFGSRLVALADSLQCHIVQTVWAEYNFKCKPGDVNAWPCIAVQRCHQESVSFDTTGH